MKIGFLILPALVLAFAVAGCGEPKGQDLSRVESQPAADLEKGREAKTIDEWAKANPNNGAPGSGEDEDK
jgi:hypothetical protein